MNSFKIRDLIERVIWTFVSAALGNITAASVLGIAVWKAALASGIVAAANALLIVARQRLAVLPDPGGAVRDETVTYLRSEHNRRARRARAARD